MAEWRINDRREAFRARKWSVERSLRTRCDDAAAKAHEFFTVRIADFVNVVPVTERDEIVLVRQFRHGIERATLELPGGLVDPEEGDPAAAALREMREETGFDLPRGGVFADLGTLLPNPALLNNRNYFFVATGVRRVDAGALEETEDVEVVLAPAGEIGGMIDRGEIDNAMMVAGLGLYERWRGRSASGPR